MSSSDPQVAGIVLCGGQSRRMFGIPKHMLMFGKERVLQRVVRLVDSVVSPVVVVAAADQKLPELPVGVELVRDRTPHLGPLAGLMYGMQAIRSRADAVYLTGCDVPLLRPEFVRTVLDRFDDEADMVIPQDERFAYPLAAVYRISLLRRIESLLRQGERRLSRLADVCERTRKVRASELRAVDPELDSLRSMNSLDEFKTLLAKCDLWWEFVFYRPGWSRIDDGGAIHLHQSVYNALGHSTVVHEVRSADGDYAFWTWMIAQREIHKSLNPEELAQYRCEFQQLTQHEG